MKLTHFALAFLLVFSVVGCNEKDVETEVKPLNGQEYIIREDFKTDDETWDTTDRRVIMQGCKEWKARDPDADC